MSEKSTATEPRWQIEYVDGEPVDARLDDGHDLLRSGWALAGVEIAALIRQASADRDAEFLAWIEEERANPHFLVGAVLDALRARVTGGKP